MTVLAPVATPSGVTVIDPKVYSAAFKNAQNEYFNLRVREIIMRCNTLLEKRVQEFQANRGLQEPGLIVTVALNSTESMTMAHAAAKELNSVGYKAKADENEHARWIEVAV